MTTPGPTPSRSQMLLGRRSGGRNPLTLAHSLACVHFRGNQVLTGPQGGRVPWGLEGPLDVWGLRVFEGSPALWVNQASWEPLDRWALLAPWGPLASQG